MRYEPLYVFGNLLFLANTRIKEHPLPDVSTNDDDDDDDDDADDHNNVDDRWQCEILSYTSIFLTFLFLGAVKPNGHDDDGGGDGDADAEFGT